MRKVFRSIFLAGLFIGVLGCGDQSPRSRSYVEFVSNPPPAAQPAARPAPSPAPTSPLSWTVPPGWTEQPGGGMRLATFLVERDGQPLECSIVSLPGNVGTLEANVRRWLGQLGFTPGPEALSAFAGEMPAMETRGGYTGHLVDLSTFPSEAGPDAPGMLAAILSRGAGTVFVKLTGSRAAIDAERKSFIYLCDSLK